MQGEFLLRIEDTDRTRYFDKAESYIIESLSWLGINYDKGFKKNEEGISYRQSERLEIYHTYIKKLIRFRLCLLCF